MQKNIAIGKKYGTLLRKNTKTKQQERKQHDSQHVL